MKPDTILDTLFPVLLAYMITTLTAIIGAVTWFAFKVPNDWSWAILLPIFLGALLFTVCVWCEIYLQIKTRIKAHIETKQLQK